MRIATVGIGSIGRLLPLVFALVLLVSSSAAADTTTDTLSDDRPWLSRLLDYYDQQFDPEARLLKVPFSGTGYHSQVPSGTEVHPVRESFYYAVALFQRGSDQDIERAKDILRELLVLQQTDPNSNNYGLWPWLKEEPLDQMDSVDLNWADFCGSAIAQILVQHRDRLGDDRSVTRMESALRHAATAIRKRNVGPGYTNIAVLGGGVCAAAGEILGDPELLGYGRLRLEKVVKLTQTINGFAEYNSPTYGKVVIGECERILQIATDPRVRKAAESIRVEAWKIVTDSFHPTAQQWAGPHSRLSQRRLTDTLVLFLNDRTGLDIQPHPGERSERLRGYGIVTPIACPENLLTKIRQPIEQPKTLKRIFRVGDDGKPSITGTTWMAPQGCLGSVNRSGFWIQRNPISGYWRTALDPAVAFRARFLRDGQDFASMGIRVSQRENRILFAVHSFQNRGDWHRTLDRPADGKFEAIDFRLQLELDGVGAKAIQLIPNQFALQAGDHEVIVSPAICSFQGQPVTWKVTNNRSRALVEAVCYSGPKKKFDFDMPIDMQLAAALTLRKIVPAESDEPPVAPAIVASPNRIDVRWKDMRTAAPR